MATKNIPIIERTPLAVQFCGDVIPYSAATSSVGTATAPWSSSHINSMFGDVTGNLTGSAQRAISASFATSASWAPSAGGGGTSLETGSTYPITSSWAISASYAPGGTGTSLGTGSTYPFTSSWAENTTLAVSTDFAILAANAVSSSYAVTASYAENAGGTGTSLGTGSTYPFTSSWSVNATSASYAPQINYSLVTGSTYPITSSWSNNAVSASYAATASLLTSYGEYILSRTLSTTVNQTTEIGNFTKTANGHNLLVSVTGVGASGISMAKTYLVVSQYPLDGSYPYSGTSYKRVAPITNTGYYRGSGGEGDNDFELDAYTTTHVLYLGVRRTQASTGTACTVTVRIINLGGSDVVFAPTTNTVASSNASWWPSSIMEQNATSQSVLVHGKLIADDAISASAFYGTSSWSNNAVSASFALTASTIGAVNYATLTTSSNWITASFTNSENYVSITAGALYSFTCSNVSTSPEVRATSVFIYNTAAATSSLSFPVDWIFIGSVPTSISSSKSAVLSLKAYGGTIVAGFGMQY